MTGHFRRITLSGSPEEIGFQHGKLLSEQIHRNIEFYKPIFLANLGDETQVLQLTEHIKEYINAFNPNYITEIDHIALGAEVSEPLWIYALNARTELALTKHYGECTAIVYPQHNIIGQTWDWAQSLEENSVIMEIQFPSGLQILQLTEAGIIGKIGLNNRGLGLTLNILWILDRVLLGVPIHILLRAVLESKTLEDARNTIYCSGNGKASNIIVAQAGQAFDIEFDGVDTIYHVIQQDEVYTHTNHYIHSAKSNQLDESEYAGSITRYKKAVEKLSKVEDFSTHEMISILSDQSNGENPILAAYKPDTQIEMGYCGTIATLVMDLAKRTMKIRKGNPSLPSFSVDSFTEFRIV
jgi:isopenicillin-N N-acyltransferase-like protein